MQNPILYYLNHIPLLMTWTYCYNEILPVRKSYWRDYLALDLGITLAVFFLLSLYAIPGSAQDHSVVRMTVSASVIGLVIYLVKRPGLKATLFALFAQQLLSITAEMVTMLITLVGVQFSRDAYESAFYMNVFSYLLLDGMSLLFFKAALSFGKKHRRSVEGEYYTIGTLLFTCQFLWLYILSYKLIYVKEASSGLLAQALGFLIVTDIVVFFSAVRIVRQKRKKQELDARRQMNAELAGHLEKLSEKQDGIETVFHEMHDLNAQIESLQVIRGRLRKLREDLYCENPYANALFNYYRQLCDHKQIAATFVIESSLNGILDEYDLNTLLSNLLKNAVEAAEFSESPFIDFQAGKKPGCC